MSGLLRRIASLSSIKSPPSSLSRSSITSSASFSRSRASTSDSASSAVPGPPEVDISLIRTEDAFFPTDSGQISVALTPTSGYFFTSADLTPRSKSSSNREREYGYLSYERDVTLGLEDAERLVRTVVHELETRGLYTPLLFSSLALDINTHTIQRLIQAFFKTCGSLPDDDQWLEELRLAGLHDLATCLCWGLSRVGRIVEGSRERGLFPWGYYYLWSLDEAARNYPPTFIAAFIHPCALNLRSLTMKLMSFLTRMIAHSPTTGYSPSTLAPIFGPLFFGLGRPGLDFKTTYTHYIRATKAMEHLILAFIRWQDVMQNSSVFNAIPTQLKQWTCGYLEQLPGLIHKPTGDPDAPRHSARRAYVSITRQRKETPSLDLIHTGASWPFLHDMQEWSRVVPKSDPHAGASYSDDYLKRLNLPPTFRPKALRQSEPIAPKPGPFIGQMPDDTVPDKSLATRDVRVMFALARYSYTFKRFLIMYMREPMVCREC